jgi:hypothetical protein
MKGNPYNFIPQCFNQQNFTQNNKSAIMTIPPKLQPVLYGIGVFIVFTALMVIMKLITHRVPSDAEYFGLFTNQDLLLGVVVAVVLTFSHERKKKLK